MAIELYQKFTPTTAVYPMAGTRSIEEAMYLGLGLNGEAGEVAEMEESIEVSTKSRLVILPDACRQDNMRVPDDQAT